MPISKFSPKLMKINHLTPSEEILMSILWKLDCAYMKDVIAHYPEPKPHQNTISTFIKILVEKEFLTTEKEGRIFKYTVAIPFTDYKNFLLSNFIERYFENSGIELLKSLRKENWVHPLDIKEVFATETVLHSHLESDEKNSEISYFVAEITADKKLKKKKNKKKKNKKTKNDK